MDVQNKCPDCKGEGKRNIWGRIYDCPKCNGTGMNPVAITFNDPAEDDRKK